MKKIKLRIMNNKIKFIKSNNKLLYASIKKVL